MQEKFESIKAPSIPHLDNVIRAQKAIFFPIVFSFKYLQIHDKKLNCNKENKKFFIKLFERLCSYSGMTIQTLKEEVATTRFHKINWEKTCIKSGFNNVPPLPPEMLDAFPYQLAITSGMGRMYGLLIDHYYYIIWFDPNHILCPRKK